MFMGMFVTLAFWQGMLWMIPAIGCCIAGAFSQFQEEQE